MTNRHYVFLNGWGFTNKIWHSFVKALPIPKENTTYIDWLDIKSSQDIDEKAADNIERLLKTHKKITLFAWSLGTLVAQKLAISFTEEIDRLILFAPMSSFIHREKTPALWDERVVRMMQRRLKKEPNGTLNDFADLLLTESEKQQRSILQSLLASSSTASLKEGLDYLIDTDVSEATKHLGQSLFLIHGEEDQVCSVNNIRYMQESTRVTPTIKIFKDTGHIPFLTNQEDVVQSISPLLLKDVNLD